MPQGASLTDPGKDAALILDGKTGHVLYARNVDVERHPASLTKIMTLYLLFEQLEAGKLKLDSQLKVSKEAAGQMPTKLGYKQAKYLMTLDVTHVLPARKSYWGDQGYSWFGGL